MSADRKKSDRTTPRLGGTSASQKTEKANCSAPVDVIDGIPDRSGKARLWKYLALAAVFLAWICFLVFCGIIGKS